MLWLSSLVRVGASKVLLTSLRLTLPHLVSFLAWSLSLPSAGGPLKRPGYQGLSWSVRRKADGSAGSMTVTANGPLGSQLTIYRHWSPRWSKACGMIVLVGGRTEGGDDKPDGLGLTRP